MAAALAAAAVLTIAFTGCSGGTRAAVVGESQTVQVKSASSATDATLLVAVEGIETRPISAETASDLGADLEGGTLFLVQYTVRLDGGLFAADDTYEFGERKWSAQGNAEISTLSSGYFDTLEVPGCEVFDEDLAARLSAGNQVEACQLFASADSGVSIERIVYGADSISYKGRGTGYSWDAE